MNAFRTSAEESERIDINCTRLRLRKSDFIRLAATRPVAYIAEREAEPDMLVIDDATAAKVYFELAAQGSNINQGIRAVNRIAKSVRQSSKVDNEVATGVMEQLKALQVAFGRMLVKNDQLLEAARPLYDAQPILRFPARKEKGASGG